MTANSTADFEPDPFSATSDDHRKPCSRIWMNGSPMFTCTLMMLLLPSFYSLCSIPVLYPNNKIEIMKVNTNLNLFGGFSGSVGETLGNDRISADWVSLLQQF